MKQKQIWPRRIAAVLLVCSCFGTLYAGASAAQGAFDDLENLSDVNYTDTDAFFSERQRAQEELALYAMAYLPLLDEDGSLQASPAQKKALQGAILVNDYGPAAWEETYDYYLACGGSVKSSGSLADGDPVQTFLAEHAYASCLQEETQTLAGAERQISAQLATQACSSADGKTHWFQCGNNTAWYSTDSTIAAAEKSAIWRSRPLYRVDCEIQKEPDGAVSSTTFYALARIAEQKGYDALYQCGTDAVSAFLRQPLETDILYLAEEDGKLYCMTQPGKSVERVPMWYGVRETDAVWQLGTVLKTEDTGRTASIRERVNWSGSVSGDPVVCVAPKPAYLEEKQAVLTEQMQRARGITILGCASLLLLMISGIYLLFASGLAEDAQGKHCWVLGRGDRIGAEWYVLGCFLVLCIVMPQLCDQGGSDVLTALEFLTTDLDWQRAAFAALLTVPLVVIYAACLSIVRRWKAGKLLETCSGYRCVKKLMDKENFQSFRHAAPVEKRMTRRLLVFLGAMSLDAFCCVLAAWDGNDGALCGLLLLALLGILLYLLMTLRSYREIGRLTQRIDRMHTGQFEAEPVVPGTASLTRQSMEQLNSISDSIRTAVDKELRAERTKIDLVTNVSHDLKTPLTSIVSYIDLLSKEALPAQARDYVQVLERKSARLTQIVADVFSLAKATAGAEIACEPLDAVVLLRQVLADMDDTITNSGRTVRLRLGCETYPIYAEGAKLYRVFQNLLDNALRYSLAGTRIYVALESEALLMTVRIQNTASYEMDFTEEDILERFARGDTSRTEDGSGLGLSIAQSFTEACGGRFRIRVDGDQFVAAVSFPRYQQPKTDAEA